MMDQPGSPSPPVLSNRPTLGLESRGFNRLSCLRGGRGPFLPVSAASYFPAFFFPPSLVHSLTELEILLQEIILGRRLSWDWWERFPLSHPEASGSWGLGVVVSFTNEEVNYAAKEEVARKSQFQGWGCGEERACEQRQGVPAKRSLPPLPSQRQKRSAGGKQGWGRGASSETGGLAERSLSRVFIELASPWYPVLKLNSNLTP